MITEKQRLRYVSDISDFVAEAIGPNGDGTDFSIRHIYRDTKRWWRVGERGTWGPKYFKLLRGQDSE